jgi:DNA-binding transcriptional regulator LsrR (DeoR family)
VEIDGTRAAAHRFSPQQMHAAARLYYLEDATQADVAARLGTSRATVSRLLSEARRQGIVRIEVVPPADADRVDLGQRTADALGLRTAEVVPLGSQTGIGTAMSPAVSRAITRAGLVAGDVLLVSSGRTVYEVAQGELPVLPGVLVAPTVGGQDEPEAWYATNEVTRMVAAKISGSPSFLYAPALPGPALHAHLLQDPTIKRVSELWEQARCAVVGLGAPPLVRKSIPRFVPTGGQWLREAVGDVCTRFFDGDGRPVDYPGSERLLATPYEVLQRIPSVVAVAVGLEKVPGIIAGARGGWFNELVTDQPTATALLAAVEAGTPPVRVATEG